MTLPVKPIDEIEVKSEVSVDDKILILDSESEEARLAPKDELKGDTGASITSASFSGNDIVFTKDDNTTVTLTGAKTTLKGDKGDAATITAGSTTTGPAGSSASVTNSGTSSEAVFNFTIPKGDKGDKGSAATVSVGSTTTGNPGTSASVTNSGTSSAAVFDFTIPEGEQGVQGETGPEGNGIKSITSSKVGKVTTVTITEDNGASASFQISDGSDGQGSGDVIGPNSSVDGNVALFDGNTGKLIKDGGDILNTRTFYLSSTSDTTTAQAAYDYYAAGKNPIIVYGNQAYILLSASASAITFIAAQPRVGNVIPGTTTERTSVLSFTLSDGTVTAITQTSYTVNVLNANTNYAIPYTPQYDGSPATKKYVDDKVADLMAIGKFLSLWNCATGLPISFPLETPYTYHTGDYFIVETVDSSDPATNYKPNGSSYSGTASSTVETGEVAQGDFYVYDGTVWLLAINHGKTVSFANLAGQPSDNANLASALNAKQDSLTASANIDITSNVIKATNSFQITSDNVTVTTTETAGVAPYNTGYKYTNYEIAESSGIEWVEGAIYSIVATDAMQPDSNHRNLRIRIGSTGDWKPVMQWNNNIYNGNGLSKSVTRLFVYKTTNQPTGALHMLSDDNTTYGQLGPSVSAGAFVVDSNGFCGRNNIIFPTTPIGTTEKWSSLCGAYASGVWSSTTAATKVAITPASGKFYIDREPQFLPTSSYTAGQTLATDTYQYYFGYDMRYSTNIADNTYVSPSQKVFLWLKNFDITDYSFVPEVSEGIVTIDKLASRFSGESGDIYLFHLGWSGPTYYQLRWNLDFQNSLYKYNVGTGTLESVRILTDKAARSGGDVVVSSQANNILTSGMKIWAGTEANYQNLGSYDQNTLYLTIE